MTGRMLAAIFFLLFQTAGTPAQQAQQQQPRKASIEGIVMSSISSEPLMRAQILLSRVQPPTPGAAGQVIFLSANSTPGQLAPFVTERDGKFSFKDLEPGEYRLRVVRNGYASQEYGQRTATTTGIPITLIEGQQLKDINFKLISAGVVTGRVRDSNGEPVGRVQVSLMRSIYSFNGQRTFGSVSSTTTDDRGDYRIFWVPPGRYVVSVTSSISSLPIELQITSSSFSDRQFPPTYYPGTLDPARASTVDLQPGAEVGGIDFVLLQPKGYKVRGKVVDSTTGQPPRSASVSVTPRQDQNAPTVLLSSALSSSNVTYNNVDGTFEIRNVIPGVYWLRSQASTNSADPVDRNLVAQARTNSDLLEYAILGNRGASTQVPIEIGGQDLEGIVLTLAPGVNIPIHLSVDGQELASIAGYDRIRVFLRATTTSSSTGNQRVNFTPEGVASIDNVSPGEYRVNVSLPPQEYFVKEARFEGNDVLKDPWQVTSRTSGTLTVVLSAKGGIVEGNLVDALSQPVSGNQVVLIPDQGRDRSELFKVVATDAIGHFTIRGIYPGAYKLYSWQALEANAYFDRDVLSQYESQGKPIRIQEGSKETLDLKLIPVKQ